VRAAVLLAAAAWAGCTTEGEVLHGGDDGGGSPVDAASSGDGATDADPCVDPGPCPAPPAGDITLCGRVIDLETSLAVRSGGPEIRVFDPVAFASDPDGAVAAAVVTPDSCGWFSTTVDGLLGVALVHTGPFPPATSSYQRVIQRVDADPGQAVRINAWVLRGVTDAAWSAAAGLGGQTFSDLGTTLLIFADVNAPALPPLQGTPVAGVTATKNGLSAPADDYYFSDTEPLGRATVDPGGAVTGADGSALVVNVSAVTVLDGDATGCGFSAGMAPSFAGLFTVREVPGNCQ